MSVLVGFWHNCHATRKVSSFRLTEDYRWVIQSERRLQKTWPFLFHYFSTGKWMSGFQLDQGLELALSILLFMSFFAEFSSQFSVPAEKEDFNNPSWGWMADLLILLEMKQRKS